MKLMLAEDEPGLSRALTAILQHSDYEVDTALDGLTALENLLTNDYDAAILDIMMPGIDGLEATRQIRALDREDAATTPIIAVSANAFADDRRLSREAGMNAHLSKPVSSQDLVEALAHIAADAS